MNTVDPYIQSEIFIPALDNDYCEPTEDVIVEVIAQSDEDEDCVSFLLCELSIPEGEDSYWAIIRDELGDQEVVRNDGYEITDDWGIITSMWEDLGLSPPQS